MPTYEIKAPNGKTYRIDGPDGATDEQVQAEVLRQFPEVGGQATQAPATPAADPNQVLSDLYNSGADSQAIIAKAGELGLRITDPTRIDAMREYEKSKPGYYKENPPFVPPNGGPGNGMENAPQPGIGETLLNSAKDLGTNLAVGAAQTFDAIGSVANTVRNLPGDAIEFWLSGGGAQTRDMTQGDGQHYSQAAGDALRTAAPRSMAEGIAATNPGAAQAPTAFPAQLLGGMAIPLPGPKGVKPGVAPTLQNGLGRAEMNALAGTGEAAAAKSPNALAGIIPNAGQVVAAGKENKVPVFRTDLKPPKTRLGESARMIGENIWLAGTGGKRAAQQKARVEAVERIAAEYGAPDLGIIGEKSQAATNQVTEAFTAARGKELETLSATKKTILEGIPGVVQTPNASRAIDAQIQKLRGINEEAYAPVIEKLKSFERALESGKTLQEVEGNRKLLGNMFADPNLASLKDDGQKALNAIYGPLREDMAVFIEANAGKGTAARFKAANDKLAAMAGELTDAKFKRVLKTADATPEGISKLLFSQTPSDVKRLVANLDEAGKAKAEAAIVLKAVEGAMLDGVVSPKKFATAMGAMRTATGLMASPQSASRLEGLTRLLEATQQASKASAFPVTGAQLSPFVATGGLSSILAPFLGGATIPAIGLAGIAARLYENKIPAQLMTQLGRTKPGSKAEAAIAKRLAPYIVKALPAANDRIEKAATMSPAPRAAADDQDK